MQFQRGSVEHRLTIAARVRLRLMLHGLPEKLQNVSPLTVRSVLGQLLSHSDMRGLCWPSTQRMADNLEIARGSVVRAMAALVASGVVSRERRAFSAKDGAAGKSTRYTLCWERLDQLSDLKSSTFVSDHENAPNHEAHRRGKRLTMRRTSASPLGANLLIEPSPLPPNGRTAPVTVRVGPDRDAVRPAGPTTETLKPTDQTVSFTEAMRLLASEGHEIAKRVANKDHAL